jgi:hypothetical protein
VIDGSCPLIATLADWTDTSDPVAMIGVAALTPTDIGGI